MCDIVINELNTGSPGILQNMDFIELFVICNTQITSGSLQGYKLIGISAGSGKHDGMIIDLVVSLWNTQYPKEMFFTIGTPGVQSTQLTTESKSVMYRNKFSGSARYNQMFTLNGNRHLHAIALLYRESYSFPELTLSMKNPYMVIDRKIKGLIADNLVDMVVYGRKTPYDDCVLFTSLYNDYANKNYILREFDNNKDGTDRTLNRCADDIPNALIPERFKLGKPTPGATNDCAGTHFFLEQHLADISDPLQQKPFDSDNVEAIEDSFMEDDNTQCSSSVDFSVYASTSVDTINAEIDTETTRYMYVIKSRSRRR